MRITRVTVSVIVALSIASAAFAQEALKGEVVTLDKASKKIGIKLSGTVGSSDATAPTPFKVQDARMFNIVKPGDKVSFTAERDDGVMTIKEDCKGIIALASASAWHVAN
jgi:Cu(I)/Ag(I) efflux system periplasmic protein CusF